MIPSFSLSQHDDDGDDGGDSDDNDDHGDHNDNDDNDDDDNDDNDIMMIMTIMMIMMIMMILMIVMIMVMVIMSQAIVLERSSNYCLVLAFVCHGDANKIQQQKHPGGPGTGPWLLKHYCFAVAPARFHVGNNHEKKTSVLQWFATLTGFCASKPGEGSKWPFLFTAWEILQLRQWR